MLETHFEERLRPFVKLTALNANDLFLNKLEDGA
jgi:hypothetical protein